MFTEQMPQAYNALISSGMPAAQAQVLMDLLGNCAQSLEHRGAITLDSPTVPSGAADTFDGNNLPVTDYPTAGNALNIAPGSMVYGSDGGDWGRPSMLNWAGLARFIGRVVFGGAGPVRMNAPMIVGGGGSITYPTPPTMTSWLSAQPIGRIIAWDIGVNGPIPTGWSVYATDGKYIKIDTTTQGTTGGNATHNHTGNTGTAKTFITVDTHATHTHGPGSLSAKAILTVEVAALMAGGAFGSSGESDVADFDGVTDVESAPLTHTVVEDPHLHSISTENNDPEFFTMMFIKKVS